MTCKSYDIPKTLVWEAWLHVKANQGAAGIDAETIERFETKLAANLYKLWNRMSSGSYFPPPVKGVPIPKKSGGVRVLGIPTVSDRIKHRPRSRCGSSHALIRSSVAYSYGIPRSRHDPKIGGKDRAEIMSDQNRKTHPISWGLRRVGS